MSDIPSVFGHVFEGYDSSLFSLDNTLTQVLQGIQIATIEKVTDGSSSATSYHYWNFSSNSDVTEGNWAIPFLYIKIANDGMANYLTRSYSIVATAGYSTPKWNSLGGVCDTTSESPTLFTMENHTINDFWGGFNTNSPFNRYYIDHSWEVASYDKPFTTITNIPIFLVDSSWDEESTTYIQQYMKHLITPEQLITLDSNVLNIMNGEQAEVPETKEYYYITRARQYTVDQYGNVTDNNQPEIYRGFKIRTQNRASVYKISGIDNGVLKMGINFSDAISCYYSNDGNTWSQVPGQPTTLPFDFTYRPHEEEIGTFYCSVGTVETNMYIFENEEDSDEYNNGDSDGRKATNYSEINSGDYDNPTGEDDLATTFGQVYTRGFFSQQYILDASSLQQIANNFYSTTGSTIIEDIKKGLEMFGDNPIDAVMGLSFWPVPLNTVFSGIDAGIDGIYFGSYKMTGITGYKAKIIYPNGYKNLGSVTIQRSFNNWRDFAPYTRLYVSLPYCGKYELDLTRYYGKSVEVRYYFDTRTNGCIACLIAAGHLMDYFNGQMGVTMPITLTDYAGYANAQMQTLLGFGGQALSTGANALSGASQIAAAGVGASAIGLAGVGVAGAALGAKTVYGLSQNNINKFNTTKGSSSSMINEYLPQYVEFTFEIQEDCAPDNYGQQYGYPSMKSGTVGSFQGFLKCQSVKLNCGVATEQERNSIKTMLLNGIYI